MFGKYSIRHLKDEEPNPDSSPSQRGNDAFKASLRVGERLFSKFRYFYTHPLKDKFV
jgi:hypothetical protein